MIDNYLHVIFSEQSSSVVRNVVSSKTIVTKTTVSKTTSEGTVTETTTNVQHVNSGGVEVVENSATALPAN